MLPFVHILKEAAFRMRTFLFYSHNIWSWQHRKIHLEFACCPVHPCVFSGSSHSINTCWSGWLETLNWAFVWINGCCLHSNFQTWSFGFAFNNWRTKQEMVHNMQVRSWGQFGSRTWRLNSTVEITWAHQHWGISLSFQVDVIVGVFHVYGIFWSWDRDGDW